MAVRKALILTTFLYFLLFVGGAIVSITIGIVQGQLDGGCLLYASGSWSYSGCREGFRACFHVVWTKVHGPCSFVTTMGAVTCLFGFGMFVYCTYTLFARSRREVDIIIFLPCIVNSILAILLIAMAGVISAGFASFCSDMVASPEISLITDCKQGQTMISWHDVDGSKFYDYTNFAQLTAWPLCGVSLILSALFWVRFYRDLKEGRRDDQVTLPDNAVM